MIRSPGSATLWFLLALILRTGSGQIADDAITLRWHGRYHNQLLPVSLLPLSVCSVSVAICLDIKLNECVRSPANFRYPYDFHVKGGTVKDNSSDFSREHGGGYLLLAESSLNSDSSTLLTLWGNCTEGCKSCSESTGIAHRITQMNKCAMTEEGGVYSIMSPGTATMCVSSLSEYYENIKNDRREAQAIALFDSIHLWPFGVVVLITCIISTLFIWCISRLMKCRRWMQRVEERVPLVDPSRAVSKSQIDQYFPSCTMTTYDELTCVVCLATINLRQEYRRLQCDHCFHTSCISNWWLHIPRAVLECPLCRRVQSLGEQQKEFDVVEIMAEREVVDVMVNISPSVRVSGRTTMV